VGELGGINLFAFCGNDPVTAFDLWGLDFKIAQPSGDDTWPSLVQAQLNTIEQMLERNVEMAKDGKAYCSLDDAKKALQNFLDLKNDTTHHVHISPADKNTYGNNWIDYNPRNFRGGTDKKGNRERPPFIGLAHEIGHAINDYKGVKKNEKARSDKFENKQEEEAVGFENCVRAPYYKGNPDRKRLGHD
jgi:hypothetical protein